MEVELPKKHREFYRCDSKTHWNDFWKLILLDQECIYKKYIKVIGKWEKFENLKYKTIKDTVESLSDEKSVVRVMLRQSRSSLVGSFLSPKFKKTTSMTETFVNSASPSFLQLSIFHSSCLMEQ